MRPQPAPGAYAMPQQPYMFPASGVARLENLSGIFIREEMDITEVLTGWEMPNKYSFFPVDQNGVKVAQRIFRGVEVSTVCDRQCVGNRREFQMPIKLSDMGVDGMDFLLLERPSACCHCDHGDMNIYMVEGGAKNLIGRCYGPCTCCSFGMQIFDATNTLKYAYTGEACQCGVVCRGCPCESCRQVIIGLNDAKGNQVSILTKFTPLAGMISDTDDFLLKFPLGSTVQDKMLLMASMIFLDYCYFESGGGGRRRHHRRY